MVEKTRSTLCEIQFGEINEKVEHFISTMEEALDDTDIEMAKLQERRVTRKRTYMMESQIMSFRGFIKKFLDV